MFAYYCASTGFRNMRELRIPRLILVFNQRPRMVFLEGMEFTQARLIIE